MSFDLKISQGDLLLVNGDLAQVVDNDKLIQDIFKIAVTPFGSNPQFKAYGTLLANSLIGQPFDASFTAEMASKQLKNGIELLKKLQDIQSKTQNLTPAEKIVAVKDVKVQQNQVDSRYWEVKIIIITGELKTASTGFFVGPIL